MKIVSFIKKNISIKSRILQYIASSKQSTHTPDKLYSIELISPIDGPIYDFILTMVPISALTILSALPDYLFAFFNDFLISL